MAVSGGVYPMDHAMQYSGEWNVSFLACPSLFLASTGHSVLRSGQCGPETETSRWREVKWLQLASGPRSQSPELRKVVKPGAAEWEL